MAVTKIWSNVGPLLRTLVEETPGIRRAIIHTDKGWPVVAWPADSFLRSAKIAFAAPGLLRRSGEFDRTIRIRNHDCVVTELPGRALLIVPLGEMCLSIDASENCDLREVCSGIARVVEDIARVVVTGGGW